MNFVQKGTLTMKPKWMAVLAAGLAAGLFGCGQETRSAAAPAAATPKGAEAITRATGCSQPVFIQEHWLQATSGTQTTPALKIPKEKISYVLGVEVARNLKRQDVDIDMDAVIKGMKDVLAGDKLTMTDDEIRMTSDMVQADVIRRRGRAKLIAALDNKAEGDAFLAENKTKNGVVTLPSGLQYTILRAGDGKKPAEADTVVCHYKGTLINGIEFDSSYSIGQPARLKVSEMIPGWREAIKLMPVGSKWRLFIPPTLGYGSRGSGRDIGPGAVLIFEVEALAIK
jgi:FKBP-type peptidyl-prolyl cis-trans isomerase FklB